MLALPVVPSARIIISCRSESLYDCKFRFVCVPVYLHNVQYLLSVVYQVRTCILSVKKLVSL